MADPAAPTDPPSEHVTFGHYRVARKPDGGLDELGRGAMGVTYRATDTELRIPVALKVIGMGMVDDDIARRRFQREARAAAQLRHPNVASVLHLGNQGGEFFYAMEFIEGRPLASLLKEEGSLPPPVALALMAQVAAALVAAHKRGLVHRDLKPANLMLLEGDAVEHDDERTAAAGGRQVKVIDFGMVRTIGAGREADSFASRSDLFPGLNGTPAYASPEQCSGVSDLDGRSDLYSLGIVLWQCLVGHPPFTGSPAQVIGMHQFQPPPMEQLASQARATVELLTALLKKEPAERRPQTAAELRDHLDALRRGMPAAQTLAPAVVVKSGGEGTADTLPSLGSAPTLRSMPPDLPGVGKPPAAKLPRWLAWVCASAGLLIASLALWPMLRGTPPVSPPPAATRLPATTPTPSAPVTPSTAATPTPHATVAPTLASTPQPTPSARDLAAEAAKRNFAAALVQASSIVYAKEKADMQREIAATQAKAGDVAGAAVTFQVAKTTAAAIADAYNKARALSEIAEAQAKTGDVAGAKATAATIADAYGKARALSEIAEAQAKAGDVTGAKATAATIADAFWKRSALGKIAKAQAKAGDLAGAKVTLEAIQATTATFESDIQRTSDEIGIATVQSTIAVAQAEAGDVTGAKATVATMTIFKFGALGEIAEAQAKAGDVAGAKATVARITDAGYKASALGAIAAAQARTGDLAGAKVTAATIENPDNRAHAQREIAAAQAGAGDLAGAKATLKTARAAAATIDEESHKARSLSSIAIMQAEVGDVAGAKAAAQQIEVAESRAEAQRAIAAVQAKAGDLAGAKETFKAAKASAAKITEMLGGEMERMLREVAAAQAKAGDLIGAKVTVMAIDGASSKNEAQRKIATAQTWQEGFSPVEEWIKMLETPEERSNAFLGVAEAAAAKARGRTKPDEGGEE